MKNDLFAVTAPGLAEFTTRELHQLGFSPGQLLDSKHSELKAPFAGVAFQGTREDIYRANLHLRTATRILIRFAKFYVTSFPELQRKIRRLPWENYLKAGQPIALRVTCHKSRLYHSDAVAERFAGAISDYFGTPSPIQKFNDHAGENLPQLIMVRLTHNQCQISIDSSGTALHCRGYRLKTAKAPLRETLAAAMLLAAKWDTNTPLLDPFCGSGTIAIEAAMLARQLAPGKDRNFAFMNWPDFKPQDWQPLLMETSQQEKVASALIIASDRDEGAIHSSLANAERAGVEKDIQFSSHALSAIEPPALPGWVISNPPYGVRLNSQKDLRNLYAQLGNILSLRCPGWNIALMCNSHRLLQNSKLAFKQKLTLNNGGVKVKLAIGTVLDKSKK